MSHVLGFNPSIVMPPNFMFMAIQIQYPDLSVIFCFAHLEDKNHEGLLDIKKN